MPMHFSGQGSYLLVHLPSPFISETKSQVEAHVISFRICATLYLFALVLFLNRRVNCMTDN